MADGPHPLEAVAVVADPLTDLVIVFDDNAELVYVNPFARRILAIPDEVQLDRQSIAEFLHPDDLLRAVEVSTLINDDQLGAPVTPALYRLRRHDGTFLPVELNGSRLPPWDGVEHPTLILGRYSGDHHLQDQIMTLLTTSSAVSSAVALVPEFGRWRHPNEHYAVFSRDADGSKRMTGSPLALNLADDFADDPDTPWARAAATRVEQVVAVDELSPALREAVAPYDLLSCWAVPVHDPLRREPAVIVAWSREEGAAPSAHRYSLDTMARSLSLIFQWRHQRTELEQAARTDALTGVVNRSAFFAWLADALTGTGQVAVLYVDLDHFKAINDEHGHATGDVVLVEVATRLREAVRADQLVARLGGDEFAVLCPDVIGDADVTRLADRLITSGTRPVATEHGDLTVGVSIGIGIAPCGAISPDELVALADGALYEVKASGRGGHRLREHP